MHRKLKKKTQYGTKNLSKGAKSRVRVLADIQNFALRAHCVCTACMAFPIWPHWRPRVGLLSLIAGLQCRPGVRPCIAPRPVRYALRPDPGSLPQDHPGSGVVAPWLPLGQLHGISSASPSSPCCPVCCVCIGAFTAGGDFPRKDALDARLPPPASRQARTGDRSRDLLVARPTLSPVELAGDPCVCLGGGGLGGHDVRVWNPGLMPYYLSRLSRFASP